MAAERGTQPPSGLFYCDRLHLPEVRQTRERLQNAVLHERRHALRLRDGDHLGHARLVLDEALQLVGGDEELVDACAAAVAGVVAAPAALASVELERVVVAVAELLELFL